MTGRRATLRDRIALTLLGLALVLRVLVPAGWMPSAGPGGLAVTICTGGTMEAAWVDTEGKLHKQPPGQGSDPHCAFAGLGAPILGGDLPPVVTLALGTDQAPLATRALAAIGQGLAAPPPPATGPPATV